MCFFFSRFPCRFSFDCFFLPGHCCVPGEILDLFDFESGGKAFADWVDPVLWTVSLSNFQESEGNAKGVNLPLDRWVARNSCAPKGSGGRFGRVLFEDKLSKLQGPALREVLPETFLLHLSNNLKHLAPVANPSLPTKIWRWERKVPVHKQNLTSFNIYITSLSLL